MTESVNNLSFGPHLYGAILHIDIGFNIDLSKPTVVDVETDEKDNFVGLALTQDGKDIYYYTGLAGLTSYLSGPLIGHNLKFDIKQLINWGIAIKPNQYFGDSCLMSYVQNTTKETHSLKDLAKEYLNMEWPTYKEMVGSGKAKQTLDKQDMNKVAAYCGMDCLATYRLHEFLKKKLTLIQQKYLESIELPTARVLLQMELQGVAIDIPYLKELQTLFAANMLDNESHIKDQWFVICGEDNKTNKEFNVNSNRQVAKLLQAQGANLPLTPKGNFKVDKATLEQLQHLPIVRNLLDYSRYEKLKFTYVDALLEQNKNGKIYANFNQLSRNAKGQSVGISTGRLSSSNPNLQNIPTKSDDGKLLRNAFIPEKNKVFIDADFSQIEPRLVAHFSKDPLFLAAFNEERDIYQDLVEGTGRNRNDGKTFMLALLYGAQPKKLASVFKCSQEEAVSIVSQLMSKLPGVTAWIERTKYEARQKKGVWTLFKRWIPLPLINSDDRYERMHWERVAVNSVIQGSAAEIMKLGLIKLAEKGYLPVITVHDEYLIESDKVEDCISERENTIYSIQSILETLVKLDIPLKCEIGVGTNWGESKL